jgi:predicted MPP superfamily phosphohydrolase
MYFILVIIGAFLILGIGTILMLRFLNRRWWRIRWIRITALLLPVCGVLCLLVGFAGFFTSTFLPIAVGMTTASFVFVLLIGLVVSLPLSGVLNSLANSVERRFHRVAEAADSGFSNSRRNFLRSSSVLFPAIAVGAGATGFGLSFVRVKVHELPMLYDNLPDQLEGFRVLHISDMHLGRYFQLGDLEQLLSDAEQFEPDMVLVTGDICDVSTQLDDTLRIIGELNPRYGCWASLGNHEYYHGVQLSRAAHSRSNVPLLINIGHTINVDGVDLYVGGADDPASLWKNADDFLLRTVNETLSGAPSDAFKIIMSHRPRGFVEAARQGVELTLAGHTHGGQIGIGGRSIFETTDPPNYYWGHYADGKSRLCTSAGVGHWFPFRLGCPAEAPVVVLKRAQGGTNA